MLPSLVLVAAINSYRTLVEDYTNLAIQRRTVMNVEETVRRTRLQVKAGKVALSDLLQQEGNLASTRLSMMQQKSSLDADYQTFLQSLGLIVQSKIKIDTKMEPTAYRIPSLKWAIQRPYRITFNIKQR